MRSVLLCTCFLVLAATPAFAQFDTATVVGTVRDATSGVVSDAKVTLTSVQTGISVVRTTGENGGYEFSAVKPGIYVVTGEKRASRSRSWTIAARAGIAPNIRSRPTGSL
jgi:hypothetical protein